VQPTNPSVSIMGVKTLEDELLRLSGCYPNI